MFLVVRLMLLLLVEGLFNQSDCSPRGWLRHQHNGHLFVHLIFVLALGLLAQLQLDIVDTNELLWVLFQIWLDSFSSGGGMIRCLLRTFLHRRGRGYLSSSSRRGALWRPLDRLEIA